MFNGDVTMIKLLNYRALKQDAIVTGTFNLGRKNSDPVSQVPGQ